MTALLDPGEPVISSTPCSAGAITLEKSRIDGYEMRVIRFLFHYRRIMLEKGAICLNICHAYNAGRNRLFLRSSVCRTDRFGGTSQRSTSVQSE